MKIRVKKPRPRLKPPPPGRAHRDRRKYYRPEAKRGTARED